MNRRSTIPLFNLALAMLLCADRGLASSRSAGEAVAVQEGVTSYPVRVEPRTDEDVRALVDAADGFVPTGGRTIECPADVCEKLDRWISPGGFTAGRLSNGEYIATWTDDLESWQLRRGRDINLVTNGTIQGWAPEGRAPRWAPSFPGYALHRALLVPEPEGVFLGVWRSEREPTRHFVALFRDERGGTIRLREGERELCVLARTNLPVLAVSASPAHRGVFGFALVLESEDRRHFHLTGFALFPWLLECMPPPS